jgi:hypothetical protein
MVRLLLRDPLILPLPEDAPEGTEPLSVSVIGPIALSRTDSLEAIESRIEVRGPFGAPACELRTDRATLVQEWIVEHVGSPVDIPKGGFLSLLQLAKTI